MSDRWFVLPISTDDKARSPKYTDKDGVTGFTGNVLDFGESQWDSFPIELPFSGEKYVVRVYGETTVLDAIASEPDTHTIASLGLSESEVSDLLNQHFQDSKTFDEWGQSFGVNN